MTISSAYYKTAVGLYCAFIFLIFAVGAALALTGCATGFSGSPSVGAQQMVYSADNDFRAALRIAVAYEALPSCPAGGAVCSDPSVVAKVTAAAKAARTSLSTAEAAVRSKSNVEALTTAALQAQADVSVFKSLAAALGSK